jgi:hypothetical protein
MSESEAMEGEMGVEFKAVILLTRMEETELCIKARKLHEARTGHKVEFRQSYDYGCHSLYCPTCNRYIEPSPFGLRLVEGKDRDDGDWTYIMPEEF